MVLLLHSELSYSMNFLICSKIFCDFGNNFIITDPDGEQPVSCMIADIEKVGAFLLKTET